MFISNSERLTNRIVSELKLVFADLKQKTFLEFYLLTKQIEKTMSTLAEDIVSLTNQVKKIGTETTATLQKVSDLEAALANSTTAVDPAVTSAFADLKAQVQIVDDLIPDAPAAPADPAPADPAAPTA